jgi:uncharacterized protein (TIGR02246 family)
MTEITGPADMPAAFQAAWNAHDMDALGALFHEDATFVNRFGTLKRGVEGIVEQHRAIHESVYQDSMLDHDLIAVDDLAAGVAIVHSWFRLTAGLAHPAGPHQVDTLLMAVLTRRDGQWRIQAAENVTLTNPMTGEPTLRPKG